MAINYTVRADVIDISGDTPNPEDTFLVDTNVWYWMTYPKATSHIPSQISVYPDYLNKALIESAKIYHSCLTLAELAHVIEKTEREIYEGKVGASVKSKEYRHNLSGQRSRVVSEVEAAWAQILNIGEPLEVTIDDVAATEALKNLQSENVDGYDLFILKSMRDHGIIKIITDDGDFATVPGIQMFTTNRNVIKAAKSQNKLVTRA